MNNQPYILTNDQWRAIATDFVKLGDMGDQLNLQMAELGYSAHQPYIDRTEMYAKTPEDLSAHRRCRAELRKERFGEPEPRMGSNPYWSVYLDQMRAERDKTNGMTVQQLKDLLPVSEYRWKQEYDPCVREQLRDAPKTFEQESERRSQLKQAWWQRFSSETAAKQSPLTEGKSFREHGQWELWGQLMNAYAEPLGFSHDKKMSGARSPVFLKVIKDNWVVVWTIEGKFFDFAGRQYLFEPRMYLVKRASKKFKEPQLGDGVRIPYELTIDWFGTAYRVFDTPAELELVIKAHTQLYSLISSFVEASIEGIL